MNTLPMIPEPVRVYEVWSRHGLSRQIGCPVESCDVLVHETSFPRAWLEHLRTHRFEPFTMEKPR